MTRDEVLTCAADALVQAVKQDTPELVDAKTRVAYAWIALATEVRD